MLLIPIFTSLILGVIFLFAGQARLVVKIGGALFFLMALFVQCSTPHFAIGVVMQTALAISLEMWRRMNAPR
jgi:hypothetical protein